MKTLTKDWYRTPLSVLIFMFIVASASGCYSPDRRPIFQTDPKDSQVDSALPSSEIPSSKSSTIAEPSWFNWPEAEEPLSLSIEEATMLALSNNQDLQVNLFTPTINGAFEQIERGAYDPELFAELKYGEERSLETSRSTMEEFDVEGEETSGALGVRQRIPTGTEIEAAVEHGRSLSNRTPEKQTARLGLTITQSLLRGLRPAVNLASVRQAELETDASLYELRGFTEALLADTEIAYWDYVLAKKEIAIFERSLEVARQQRDEIELRIEVGVLPKNEAAAARAEVALREQALIDARSTLEERRLQLLRLIGPGPAGRLDYRVDPTSEPRIVLDPINDLQDRIHIAVGARPDLGEARLRLEQNRLETIVTRNGLLPRLDLFIALGKTGYGDSFSESFRAIDGDAYDLTGGVSFTHELGRRRVKGLDLAALASRRQAAEAVVNLQRIVELDVRLAVNETERARQQITATAATRSLQEQVLVAEMERFNVGAGTPLLVAQAQRDLLESRIAEIEAIVNCRVALVRLYLSEGSLLERRWIDVPATPELD